MRLSVLLSFMVGAASHLASLRPVWRQCQPALGAGAGYPIGSLNQIRYRFGSQKFALRRVARPLHRTARSIPKWNRCDYFSSSP